MEKLNAKFDKILDTKMQYIQETLSTKTQKMSNLMSDEDIKDNKDNIDYTAKQTLSKIALEQDRKHKSSKAYKNAQDYRSI